MELLTSKPKKKKTYKRKNTFRLADCISNVDVFDTDKENIAMFFFVYNKLGEERNK